MVAGIMKWDPDENSCDFGEPTMDQAQVSKFYNHIGITPPILGNQSPETVNNLPQVTELAKDKAGVLTFKSWLLSL